MYNVSQGVFVDGSIIDAADFLDEFGAVSRELSNMNTELSLKITKALAESKKYTDVQVDTVPVDGGTF